MPTRPLMVAAALLLSAWPGLGPSAGAQDAPATPPATRPAVDAADLYLRAADAVEVDSPANSIIEYPGYPPFGDEWGRLAASAWEANGPARALARAARSADVADWPSLKDRKYLQSVRRLTNDLGDAALHDHFRGNDAGAVERVRDVLHLSRLLRRGNPADDALLLRVIAGGIDDSALHRLMVVLSDVTITDDPANARDLQADQARRLLSELLDPPDVPREAIRRAFATDHPAATPENEARAVEVFERHRAEHGLAAVSLAAHLFRFDRGRWPASLDELAPAHLPRVPPDPFGDGAQPIGYALIKGGLPGGSDRPLAYSRDDSPDGLRYRTDRPLYARYTDDGSRRLSGEMLHAGQFRDIACWTPGPGGPPERTLTPPLRPLP